MDIILDENLDDENPAIRQDALKTWLKANNKFGNQKSDQAQVNQYSAEEIVFNILNQK